MIVQFRHGTDRGTRGAHRVGLVDGDGGRDSFNRGRARLAHAIQELARAGREGLDVAVLLPGAAVGADEMTVYKSATCGCGNSWIKHMEANGFKVKGIAVPGMPHGSPGMESPAPQRYQTLSFDEAGCLLFFASHQAYPGNPAGVVTPSGAPRVAWRA